MIWDIIRDWFVMNIFGGMTSTGNEYSVGIGYVGTDDLYFQYGNETTFNIGKGIYNVQYITFSDWLSTTATLIVLIAICVALFFLVRYFFRMFAGLLSGR